MLRPTPDFKDMNDFIAQFRRKPANSNWQLAVSQKEASTHSTAHGQPGQAQQPEASQQEAESGQGEPHGTAGQAGQAQQRVIGLKEILKNPKAFVMQDGPYPNVTDDYVLARDGSLVHPRQMEWDVEDRIKERLGMPRHLDDEDAMRDWHRRQLALLEKADAAPRCEHVFIDGTTCQSPRMRKHKLCYAHARMLEVRPKKLKLLPAEDENSIMWNIMEIQRALIDDEITEKRAGLLLYGQQLQLIAVRGVTFKQTDPESVVRVMPKTVSRELTRMNTKEGRQESQNTYHGDTETRRKQDLAAGEPRETQKDPTTDPRQAGTGDTDDTDQDPESKTVKSERAQSGAEQHRQERRCHTGVSTAEGGGATQSIAGDELRKSLLSGDEGAGGQGARIAEIPAQRANNGLPEPRGSEKKDSGGIRRKETEGIG